MRLPNQSTSTRTVAAIAFRMEASLAGIEPQQFLGCQTGPCKNGRRYRVCVTRKTVCREISGSEELGIPSETVCIPGDYDVRVQTLKC